MIFMKKTILIIINGIIFFFILSFGVYVYIIKQEPKIVMNAARSGTINQDEIWGEKIFITGDITVKRGVTLAILPGTVVNIGFIPQ